MNETGCGDLDRCQTDVARIWGPMARVRREFSAISRRTTRWPPSRRTGTTAVPGMWAVRPCLLRSPQIRPTEAAREIRPRSLHFAGDRFFRLCDRRREAPAARPGACINRVHRQLQLAVPTMRQRMSHLGASWTVDDARHHYGAADRPHRPGARKRAGSMPFELHQPATGLFCDLPLSRFKTSRRSGGVRLAPLEHGERRTELASG